MSRDDRSLLENLARAHRLGFREKRLCRRLAKLYGLEGSDGPESGPAALFFRPSFWDVFLRDSLSSGDRRLPAVRIEALRDKLFGQTYI